MPTMTVLPITIGAMVEKYCCVKGANSLFQRSFPVFASSETMKSSGVTMNSALFHSPKPRLPIGVPPRVRQK